MINLWKENTSVLLSSCKRGEKGRYQVKTDDWQHLGNILIHQQVVHYSLIYSSPRGTSYTAARPASRRRNWSSGSHSPVWPSHRRTCRAAALPPPCTGGRTPCTGRGVCPQSTRPARWSWRRTSSSRPLFGSRGPGDWGWWSGCRTGPGTWGWWWAHRSPHCCSRRTGSRHKSKTVIPSPIPFDRWWIFFWVEHRDRTYVFKPHI